LKRIIKYYFSFFFVKQFFIRRAFLFKAFLTIKKELLFTLVHVVCQQKIKVFLINYYYLFAEESIGQNK